MRVLAVNAGSSSLKLSLLAPADKGDSRDITIEALQLEAPGGEFDRDRLRAALDSQLGQADAVGHRIVHGGECFRSAVRIDAGVQAQLRRLVDLAPLHQPASLAALDAVGEALPELPAVACFDTSFHATIPAAAATYALPASWRECFGLRRYGFHGLSHAWVARRVPELLGVSGEDLRVVSCHLGAGASLCAIRNGVSLDTTMGFTPLEGLVMASRCGSVDPGMLMWLLEQTGISTGEMTAALEHRSGLLGLAGSSDMREILQRAEDGDAAGALALDVYTHRLCGAIAAMAAALGGLDVLAFTGGIGERSAEVRARACAGVAFLGVCLNEPRNLHRNVDGGLSADAEIGAEGARVRTVAVAAGEDLEIAREVRMRLARRSGSRATRS